MMHKDWVTHVPLIYVRNRGSKDQWSLVGADHHDCLEVIENGKYLRYSNMQNCETLDSDIGYEFHGEPDCIDEYGTLEYHIQMIPWTDAIKIYKKHDKSYRRFFRLMKNAARKVIKKSKRSSIKEDPPRTRLTLEEARRIIAENKDR